MRILLTTAAMAAALLVSTPSITYGQDAEDAEILRMAKEHYKLGLDAFKAGKYPDAIKELKKAYLLKRLPPLLVNIAKTYDKLNDLDNSIYYYKKYLAEAPPDAKDRDQVKQALAEIQQRKNAPAEEASRSPEDLPEAKGPSRGGDTAEEAQAPRPRRRPVAETEEAASPEDNTARPRRRPVAETEQASPPDEAAPPRPRRRIAEEEQAPADETVARTTRPRRTDDEVAPPPARRTPPPPVDNEEPAARKAPPSNVPMPTEWAHNPIDAAPPQNPVDVRVQTPVMKGVKVYLYYREAGQADFTPVLMKRHGSEKVGRIPGEAMAGKSIQYYIEAKDKTGNVVKSSGSQVDPNIVMIEVGAPPQLISGGGRASEGDEVGGEEVASGDEQRPPPVSRPRREEHPLDVAPTPDEPEQRKPAGPSGPVFKTLGWIGLGLAGAGVVAAGAGGGVGLYIANRNSNLLYNDATNTNCRNQANSKYSGKCYFLDPAFQTGQSDYDFDQQGKLAGTLAPIAIGVGGAMVAGGVALMVIDYIKLHPSQPAAPKRKRRRAVPTRDEQSSIQNLIVAPIFSPTTVGAAAGFNF